MNSPTDIRELVDGMQSQEMFCRIQDPCCRENNLLTCQAHAGAQCVALMHLAPRPVITEACMQASDPKQVRTSHRLGHDICGPRVDESIDVVFRT